ncbi:hypothetical protein CAPTEDRAFT_76081, partial [Capitella teleta]
TDSIEKGLYDPCDLERVQTENAYVHSFLQHTRGNQEKAVAMIDSSLRWRKELELSSLTESSFPREVHEIGAMFYRNEDRNGRKILYFRVSKSKKDPDKLLTVKKYVAWWLDKHFLKHPGVKIVPLFDMTDAGIGNMDIELIKFQIACFASYYPGLLDYMLIYEMPWVLNAIWKLIRNVLSAEQQKAVLFVKKAEIQQYVAPDHLFVHMGGTDTYTYTYMPSEDSGIEL